MYVLLNLRDPSRLSDVVQLLFSHGHTAVSVAETIGDLCPSCQNSAQLPLDTVERPESEILEQLTVPVAADLKPALTASLEETLLLSPECPLPNGDNIQAQKPSHSISTPLLEQTQSNRADTLECAAEKVKSRERRSRRSTSKSTPQSSISTNNEKDLQTRCEQTDVNESETVWNENLQLTPTSFDLLTGTSNTADLCQLCKKAISRQGQMSNIVNHLSRHARLHASRKQYSCPMCRASFSRRYLAYSHTSEAHSKHGHIEPVDYGRELREEYKELLEMCFPGTSTRRKRRSRAATKAAKRKTSSLGAGIPP
ncbi:hypothetical protein KIN20_011904 [Parelaphostrongylus tenuis]|uniref:C2H2-type domain-containing protein n=1 Tax=Parelaphostrongylus tenuis TaxID=148309 RepID=A0AAD5MA42_PARTN|nr:hypothetical protein KIN20_011904 [Parelaphostrongylus tenuis]